MPGIWFFLPFVGFTVKRQILTQFNLQDFWTKAYPTNQKIGRAGMLSSYVFPYFVFNSEVLISQVEE